MLERPARPHIKESSLRCSQKLAEKAKFWCNYLNTGKLALVKEQDVQIQIVYTLFSLYFAKNMMVWFLY